MKISDFEITKLVEGTDGYGFILRPDRWCATYGGDVIPLFNVPASIQEILKIEVSIAIGLAGWEGVHL